MYSVGHYKRVCPRMALFSDLVEFACAPKRKVVGDVTARVMLGCLLCAHVTANVHGFPVILVSQA